MQRDKKGVSAMLTRLMAHAYGRAVDPKNVSKGPWVDYTVDTAVNLVVDEVRELAEAVMAKNIQGVYLEAGDVVWSLAILIDVCERASSSKPA